MIDKHQPLLLKHFQRLEKNNALPLGWHIKNYGLWVGSQKVWSEPWGWASEIYHDAFITALMRRLQQLRVETRTGSTGAEYEFLNVWTYTATCTVKDLICGACCALEA